MLRHLSKEMKEYYRIQVTELIHPGPLTLQLLNSVLLSLSFVYIYQFFVLGSWKADRVYRKGRDLLFQEKKCVVRDNFL